MIRKEPVMPDKQEKGTVEFDHVSFAYPEAGENVINDITFKAEKARLLLSSEVQEAVRVHWST